MNNEHFRTSVIVAHLLAHWAGHGNYHLYRARVWTESDPRTLRY